MPITYDEALQHTNPSDTEEQRDVSAKAIVAGVAANDIYWSHTDPLTALRARHEGHGEVVSDYADVRPPVDIESTAVDEGEQRRQLAESPHESSPTNPGAAIATLRKQLQDAGINPEA